MRKMEREHCTVASSCWPHLLWLGDFNSHHLLWDKPRNSHLFTRASLERAQEIIEVIASYDLQMVLPGGMPTIQALSMGNFTRPNNIFASTRLVSMVVECRAVKGDHPVRS